MIKLPITVTQPSLPPLEDVYPYLEKIWTNKILTNNGPLHKNLEDKITDYLKIENLVLFNNCTTALVCAIKYFDIIDSEIITTPFSFIATAHSILWTNNRPVFVDIDIETFNIDKNKIEKSITHKTKAILAVHVYGNPCDHQEINEIAEKYNLKVIYDAAHAFGVRDDNQSILNYGDLSVVSFHATKVFNTFEGGAIICKTKNEKNTLEKIKNFGFENEVEVDSIGLNGKLSEFNAAIGLLQLNAIDKLISKRKKLYEYYMEKIKNIKGLKFQKIKNLNGHNYSYFPIIIENDFHMTRDDLYNKLKLNHIYARRYFYPLISNTNFYKKIIHNNDKLEHSNYISDRILCLPMHAQLDEEHIDYIVKFLYDEKI